MTDDEALDFLIEIFQWPNDPLHRYHALRILFQARGCASKVPSWDDFQAGVVR